MTSPSSANTRGPVQWDIRGVQNNWNWRVEPTDDCVGAEYQTRFPGGDLAHMYRGTSDAAPLLATIKTEEVGWTATITFPDGGSPPVTMENVSGQMFHTKWPVHVRALEGRELVWEYEHPAYGNNSILLLDAGTSEPLGSANDNYLELSVELSEAAVEELVIMGTAVQIMLASLMHNDMTIAVEGPEGAERWKYQEPNWWENENDDVEEDDNE